MLRTAAGVVVLALGKHGARELNYSSDIDLIVLYDPARSLDSTGAEPGPLFVRSTRALTRLLQERTGEGYVLRSTCACGLIPPRRRSRSRSPARYLLRDLGQNWERAALIKARPAAGDIKLGERFLADLAPFIWRKYFDYAAIADIHAMKRQIHAVRGHERGRRPRPRRQTRPRRHPRNRIFRPDATAHFWRTPPPDARLADA